MHEQEEAGFGTWVSLPADIIDLIASGRNDKALVMLPLPPTLIAAPRDVISIPSPPSSSSCSCPCLASACFGSPVDARGGANAANDNGWRRFWR